MPEDCFDSLLKINSERDLICETELGFLLDAFKLVVIRSLHCKNQNESAFIREFRID